MGKTAAQKRRGDCLPARLPAYAGNSNGGAVDIGGVATELRIGTGGGNAVPGAGFQTQGALPSSVLRPLLQEGLAARALLVQRLARIAARRRRSGEQGKLWFRIGAGDSRSQENQKCRRNRSALPHRRIPQSGAAGQDRLRCIIEKSAWCRVELNLLRGIAVPEIIVTVSPDRGNEGATTSKEVPRNSCSPRRRSLVYVGIR